MKYRTPKSFAAALTKIMSALSDDRCAEIVGRSDSLIRKWADPDNPSLPTLAQAMALDVMYVREGHGPPPILEIYEKLVEDAVSESESETVDILLSMLSIQGVIGDLSEAIGGAFHPDSPGGRNITAAERQTILEILDRLDKQTNVIEDVIEG